MSRPSAVARWGWPGALAGALITVGGAITGPRPSGVDFGAAPRLHALLGDRPVAAVGFVALYGGLVLLVRCWLRLGSAIRNGERLATSDLWLVFALWALPLALGPPLFSRDVYSYAAQGRMVAKGINPYAFGPIALGPGRYLNAVAPFWARARVPYGPLFLSLDAAVVRVAGGDLVLAVLGLRALELVGVGLLAVCLPRLAVQHGVPSAAALWLGLLNPLVLLHLVSGAHNDALMLGLLAAGLVAAGEGHPVAGLVACTLAAAVKIPAAAGALYVALDWYRRDRRAVVPARAAATVGLTFVALTAASGLGWGWVRAITTPDRVWAALSPVTGAAMAAGGVAHFLRVGLSTGLVVGVARGIGLGAAATIALLLATSHRLTPLRAAALALSALVLFGPVVQPWYVTWGLVLLAAAGPGTAEPVLVAVSVALAFVIWPSGSGLPMQVQALVVVGIAAFAATTLLSKRRALQA